MAAEITLTNGHPDGCSGFISGEIVPGDAEKAQAAFPGKSIHPITGELAYLAYDNRLPEGEVVLESPILCLDSPGGSFLEGLKLARYFRDTGIATHVTASSTCESACALAFLGGTHLNYETYEGGLVSDRARSLDASAVLGFHQPGLGLSERQFNQAYVKAAFSEAINATALVVSRVDELRISVEFALKFLAVPPDEMLHIDSPDLVDQLGVKIKNINRFSGSLITNEKVEEICASRSSDFKIDPRLGGKIGAHLIGFKYYVMSGFEISHNNFSESYILLAWRSGEGGYFGPVCHVQFLEDKQKFENSLLTVTMFEEVFYDRSDPFNDTEPSRAKIADFVRTRSVKERVDLSPVLLASNSRKLSDLSSNPVARPAPASRAPSRIQTVDPTPAPTSAPVRAPAALSTRQPNASDVPTGAPAKTKPLATPDDETLLKLDRNARREIQRRLTLLGFDTKGVDGSFGPNSRAAIQIWQQERDFPVSGYLDDAQLVRLTVDSDDLYEKWKAEEAKKPQKRRVKVCQRGPLGLLINCRIEWR